MKSGVDRWLDVFKENPTDVWRNYVCGLSPIPGYARADKSHALSMVFAGLAEDDPLKKSLDVTLTAWFDQCLAWSDEERREFGLSRYVYWLMEVQSAASRLQLTHFRQNLYDNLPRYRGLLLPLRLASFRDPLAELYWTLAGSAKHAPTLQPFWLRMCGEADDIQLPGYYLDMALLGLRQCDPPIQRGAPPWIAGFAAWLPYALTKHLFLRKFSAFLVMYPQYEPRMWRRWIYPVLDTLSGRVDSDRIEWWRKALGGPSQRTKGANKKEILKSPYPEDLEKVLLLFNQDGNREIAKGKLISLFTAYDRYAERTGETYYLVRATAKVAKAFLRHNKGWMVTIASGLLRRTLVREPWDMVCWHLYGRCLAALGYSLAAEWVFWESARRGTNDVMVYTELGRLFVDQDRFSEAEVVFREIIEIDQNDFRTHMELGKLLLIQDRFPDAEILFLDGLKIDGNNPYFQIGLECARNRKRWESDQQDAEPQAEKPPKPQPILDDANQQETGHNSHDCEEFRTPSEAKRADFFLRPGNGKSADRLHSEAKASLEKLFDSDGHDMVVRFYARRHGLTTPGELYGADKQAWALEEAANLSEGRQDQLRALAKEEAEAEAGQSQLPNWLYLAAGDVDRWPVLCAWQKRMKERDERSRRFSPTDAFLFSEIARFQEKNAQNPPAEAALLASLRRVGEMRLSVATDPLPEQNVA